MFQGTGMHQNTSQISYTQFNQQVTNGLVKKVTIQGDQIVGETQSGQQFTTVAPPNDSQLTSKLLEKNVDVNVKPGDDGSFNLMSIFINWFPMLLLIAVWVFFLRQMQAGGGKAMGFGKSRAKLLTERQGRVTFEDVAGGGWKGGEKEGKDPSPQGAHRNPTAGAAAPQGGRAGC